ncbi:MAG: hypothetical protein HOY79_04435 [Streptomyces sp.]|nr:hypothetical protein [Streptomyces sp.]NUS15453.1 hypothetical protein [Streptomyces sp.]NUS24089.1 hypothetical protein [Streptomyces sp.]
MTSTRAAKKTTAAAPAPAKKTAAKRTAPAKPRTPRKRTPRKAAPGAPTLSLVKAAPQLPARERPFMTDVQGFATCAALMVGIPTVNIRDWRDHRNGTCTRQLRDGSHLHYNLTTRTLTWQAVCRMGATHEYPLVSRSGACAARLHADACNQLHADLTTIKPLTADELEALGLHAGPTWAQKNLPGDPDVTETLTVPIPEVKQTHRTLADQLTRSGKGIADTHPMSLDEIHDGLIRRAAEALGLDETVILPKEHPQP